MFKILNITLAHLINSTINDDPPLPPKLHSPCLRVVGTVEGNSKGNISNGNSNKEGNGEKEGNGKGKGSKSNGDSNKGGG